MKKRIAVWLLLIAGALTLGGCIEIPPGFEPARDVDIDEALPHYQTK